MTPTVDINNTVVQTLPFTKRISKWILFVQSVCYPIKWLYNVLAGYMNGTVTVNYNVTATYALNDNVIYNYGVWQSLIAGNLGNLPNYTPYYSITATYAIGNCVIYNNIYYVCKTTISSPETFNPAHWTVINTVPWLEVNNSFIGAREMTHYGGGKITLEWALNRYFQTVFRQPNDPISPAHSDIYITTLVPAYSSFISYTTEPLTSDVYTTHTFFYVFTDEVYTFATSYNFEVHIPIAVYTAINPLSIIADTVIRRFLDQYVVSGVQYTIVTY